MDKHNVLLKSHILCIIYTTSRCEKYRQYHFTTISLESFMSQLKLNKEKKVRKSCKKKTKPYPTQKIMTINGKVFNMRVKMIYLL